MKVKVTNNTGHRIPSGYPDGRRMWIGVAVKNGANTVYESGHYDQAQAILSNSATDTALTHALSNVIGAGTILVGNPLQARAIASDGASNVLVMSPVVLPGGTLTAFQTFVQPGSETLPFEAFVLRPPLRQAPTQWSTVAALSPSRTLPE